MSRVREPSCSVLSRLLRCSFVVAVAVAVALVAGGCQKPSTAQLVVCGSPSLSSTFVELADLFRSGNPDLHVRTSFVCPPCVSLEQDASKMEGDIFIATGDFELKAFREKGLIRPGSAVIFARGALSIAARQKGVRLSKLDDLAGSAIERIVVGNPDHVASGHYFKQALDRAGLWSKVQSKIVPTESGCRVVRLLRPSHGDVAAVFEWCASQASDLTCLMNVPENLHDPIYLYGAASAREAHPVATSRFLEFLRSGAAARVLKAHGFLPADTPAQRKDHR